MLNDKSNRNAYGVVCLAILATLMLLIVLPGVLYAQSNKSVATKAIQTKYQQLNGQNGVLGKTQSTVKATYDKKGYLQDYERGSIYWHPQFGVHEVHGAIFLKWYALGRAGGLLGYPLTDETKASDGKGRYSTFEHGVIYWHPSIGNTAYEVHGGILAKWKQLGSERSSLGYPITDEQDTPQGNGRVSLFQYGAIYWNRGSGGAAVEYSTSKSSAFGNPKLIAPTPQPTPTPCTSNLCTIPTDSGYHIFNIHTAYCSSPDYDACTGTGARNQFAAPNDICLRWRESSVKNAKILVKVWQGNSLLASDSFSSPGGQDLCKSIPVTLSGNGGYVAEIWHDDKLQGTASWSVAAGSTAATPTPTTLSSSASAGDGLHFRNNTSNTVWLAVGYKQVSSGEWVSEGWYEINPGQTRTVIAQALTSQYYYYYAVGGGITWEGKYQFWTHPTKAFGPLLTTLDASSAQNQGYARQGFREIDVGSYTSYTYTLNP